MSATARTDLMNPQYGLKSGQSYIIVVGASGRQHNVVFDRLGECYLFGKVGMERQLMLVRNDSSPYLTLMVVDAGAAERLRKSGPAKIVFEEACVLPAKDQGVKVRIDAIDLIEDTWRVVLPSGVVDDNGFVVDLPEIADAIPAIKQHMLPNGQLVEQPSAWPTGAQVANLRPPPGPRKPVFESPPQEPADGLPAGDQDEEDSEE